MNVRRTSALDRYKSELSQIVPERRFVVFLCGPSIKDLTKSGARLRKRIKEALESVDFEVVLGEDDGLEESRLSFGMDAQENEMQFVRGHCNAIVLLADSVGSYCELGLFSHHVQHNSGRPALIVLIKEKYSKEPSYLNEGPATVADNFGKLFYIDFENFDVSEIIKRLKHHRAVYWLDLRGRPRKKRG